jgi:hypothetical protein
VLAACLSPTPCAVTTKLSSGRTTLAQTGRELIGSGELAYLTFRLGATGQALLARAKGNQLGARVTLSAGTATSNASIALTRF